MKKSLEKEILTLPRNPGVYLFRGEKKEILYVGKATDLRSRVSSYFSGSEKRENAVNMLPQISKIEYFSTDSALEALLLEARLIKKHQPKYNMLGKDDKSFAYFVITREEFPRVLIFRETDLAKENRKNFSHVYGPYASKKQMENALKIMRKIFPFHSRREKTEKGCLEHQIGLCPGPYAGKISRSDYGKNINGLRAFLEGKKITLLKKTEQEMKNYAQKKNFEKAAQTRDILFALKHINDTPLLTEDFFDEQISRDKKEQNFRLEAYDISNISGQHAVGSMAVFIFDGKNIQLQKDQYRRFRIKQVIGINDPAMLQEVLRRRLRNPWTLPDLIILDGGLGQLRAGEKVLKDLNTHIPLTAAKKGPTRKMENMEILFSKNFPLKGKYKKLRKILGNQKFIKQITDEAHRFAITYHRHRRNLSFLEK